MTKDVRIYIDVHVARAGMYAADIKVVTFDDDMVVYDKTFEYPRRTYESAIRKAYKTARDWCTQHGYEEIEWEDEDEDDDDKYVAV